VVASVPTPKVMDVYNALALEANKVVWDNGIYLQPPGVFMPLEAIKAIDKMIVLGA